LPLACRRSAGGAGGPHEQHAVADRQERVVDARVLLDLRVERGHLVGRVQDAAAPQHVVEGDDAVRRQQREREVEVRRVLGLARVDVDDLERAVERGQQRQRVPGEQVDALAARIGARLRRAMAAVSGSPSIVVTRPRGPSASAMASAPNPVNVPTSSTRVARDATMSACSSRASTRPLIIPGDGISDRVASATACRPASRGEVCSTA